ncbi:MAG: hypothetical protein HC904_10935 [Blastochloris sp.]|nr:hypothetical protein [Blastochloris sp.]
MKIKFKEETDNGYIIYYEAIAKEAGNQSGKLFLTIKDDSNQKTIVPFVAYVKI